MKTNWLALTLILASPAAIAAEIETCEGNANCVQLDAEQARM